MTIAIDFDGVIHSYERGWDDGTIYGEWKPNAMAAVLTLMERDAVFIHTTRNPRQVARWIERTSGHNIDCTTHLPRTWYGRRKPFWNTRGLLLITDRKLPANVYIDDRAHHFEAWDKTMVALGEPIEHWPTAADDLCAVGSVGGERCTRAEGHRLHSFEADGAFEQTRKAIRQARGETAPQAPISFGPCGEAAQPDSNSGPGWYEVITPGNALTAIALVYEDGSLYLPEGHTVLTPEEFAIAAAQGKAHRLVRADDRHPQ